MLLLITLPPGNSAPLHNHPGIGVEYVLDGVYKSQYEGEELKLFKVGDAIYDFAQTPHLIARNASSTETLRFLMMFIVRRGEPTAKML